MRFTEGQAQKRSKLGDVLRQHCVLFREYRRYSLFCTLQRFQAECGAGEI